MAPPASAFCREAERAGQALKRAHLFEQSEFVPFSLSRLRSRQNGAGGVIPSVYLFLSDERRKKYNEANRPDVKLRPRPHAARPFRPQRFAVKRSGRVRR